MYIVRMLTKNIFQISKFEDSVKPTAVYQINNGKCNCPASYRSSACKHKDLLKQYFANFPLYAYEDDFNPINTRIFG